MEEYNEFILLKHLNKNIPVEIREKARKKAESHFARIEKKLQAKKG